MNDMVNTLKNINSIPTEPKPKYEESERLKAFIITMYNDSYSSFLSRVAVGSIEDTNSLIDYCLFPATVPNTIAKDLKKITYIKDADKLPWTWPINDSENGYDLKTGLYKKAYRANDQRKVIACMVSHMRLWQMCIDLNQPIMVLEHDIKITNRFDYNKIKDKFTGGIVGINDPHNMTRKHLVFRSKIVQNLDFNSVPLIQPVPSVDDMCDLPLPQGLAGNSAYIIKPWAAKALFDKIQEIGMWPNDALICKQLFPWIQVSRKFFTTYQPQSKSTTTL